MSAPAKSPITHVRHVGMAVPNFTESVEFYRNTWGLELVAEVHVPDFLCVLPVADFGPGHEDRVTGCRQLEIANVGPGLL